MVHKNKMLASLAVFRELYDENKDIYQIIADFLLNIIQSKSLNGFSLKEISEELNNTYQFDIPDAVVKTALKKIKFLKKRKRKISS